MHEWKPASGFEDTDEKVKGPGIAKTLTKNKVLGLAFPGAKTGYRRRVMKTQWCWCGHREVDDWNRIHSLSTHAEARLASRERAGVAWQVRRRQWTFQ